MQRSSVDFPEPERPKITTTSPRSHLHVDALQHLERAEVLVEVLDADDRLVAHGASLLVGISIAICRAPPPGRRHRSAAGMNCVRLRPVPVATSVRT